jgi:hypothetical protein
MVGNNTTHKCVNQRIAATVYPRNIFFFRFGRANTRHKYEYDDDDDDEGSIILCYIYNC